jgi:hypothetical protein
MGCHFLRTIRRHSHEFSREFGTPQTRLTLIGKFFCRPRSPVEYTNFAITKYWENAGRKSEYKNKGQNGRPSPDRCVRRKVESKHCTLKLTAREEGQNILYD